MHQMDKSNGCTWGLILTGANHLLIQQSMGHSNCKNQLFQRLKFQLKLSTIDSANTAVPNTAICTYSKSSHYRRTGSTLVFIKMLFAAINIVMYVSKDSYTFFQVHLSVLYSLPTWKGIICDINRVLWFSFSFIMQFDCTIPLSLKNTTDNQKKNNISRHSHQDSMSYGVKFTFYTKIIFKHSIKHEGILVRNFLFLEVLTYMKCTNDNMLNFQKGYDI